MVPPPSSPTATAVLFPGQGSQREGMRDTVAELRPELLDWVIEECGCDPFERLDEGTRFQQPAILCASLAGWTRARAEAPTVLAGHSLGELSALAAAGVIAERDAVRIVAVRGAAMADAAASGPPSGMLAARAGMDVAAEIATLAGAAVANENAADQVVLAGTDEQLDAAAAVLRERGLRSMRLPVSGGFHSSEMVAAEAPLRAALAATEIAPGEVEVLSSLTGSPFTDPRAELVAALTRPVRWVAVTEELARRGVARCVEAGPGSVLTKLVRRALPGVEAESIDAPEAARA